MYHLNILSNAFNYCDYLTSISYRKNQFLKECFPKSEFKWMVTGQNFTCQVTWKCYHSNRVYS